MRQNFIGMLSEQRDHYVNVVEHESSLRIWILRLITCEASQSIPGT